MKYAIVEQATGVVVNVIEYDPRADQEARQREPELVSARDAASALRDQRISTLRSVTEGLRAAEVDLARIPNRQKDSERATVARETLVARRAAHQDALQDARSAADEAARLDSELVANRSRVWSPPDGYELVPAPSGASPGATWDGTAFTEPAAKVRSKSQAVALAELLVEKGVLEQREADALIGVASERSAGEG